MTEVPIIGMSPGNSYFKYGVVKKLLEKVLKQYGRAVVMIADVPAISTYVALGYPENRARRDKVLPQSNALKNRIRKSIDEAKSLIGQVKVIDWAAEVENDPRYKEKYSDVSKLYEINDSFRKTADDATREVLEYADKEIPNLETATKIAVHYLLSEIAFMEFAPEFLSADKVVYIYHRSWSVYEKYIAGDFDNVPRPYLGFLIQTVE